MATETKAIKPGLVRLVNLLFLLSLVALVLRLGFAVQNVGPGFLTCVDTRDALAPIQPLFPGVTNSGGRLCDASPDLEQQFLLLVHRIAVPAFTCAVLWFLARWLRTASKGPFDQQVPVVMRGLGRLLTVGGVVAPLVQYLSAAYLIRTMTSFYDWRHLTTFGVVPFEFRESFSFTLVLVGLVMIAFAKIMRAGVEMRKDLEGTV
ncbi:hypothetical protein D5S17_01745 [Pseudonocardiaceae bacterium YIM PH 21723]|nr:hypothetical protein D5S17_01745 [Pseudonocardiaceae bacterium YIM PH 21723]